MSREIFNLFKIIALNILFSGTTIGLIAWLLKKHFENVYSKKELEFKSSLKIKESLLINTIKKISHIYPELLEIVHRSRNKLRDFLKREVIVFDNELQNLCNNLDDSLISWEVVISDPIYSKSHNFKTLLQNGLILLKKNESQIMPSPDYKNLKMIYKEIDKAYLFIRKEIKKNI